MKRFLIKIDGWRNIVCMHSVAVCVCTVISVAFDLDELLHTKCRHHYDFDFGTSRITR